MLRPWRRLLQKSKEDIELEKRRAALAAARWVADGMHLGLGSGSTAAYFIQRIGRRVRDEGLRVLGVPTSIASRALAQDVGIPLREPARGMHLDLTVDGADEIDPSLMLIKGGGGALLREKVIASASRSFIVIADSSKRVTMLGRFPLPLEVVPFAAPLVMDRVERLGGAPTLRPDKEAEGQYAQTDQGNWLVDCRFKEIPDPPALAQALSGMPGVVEHGLFIGLARAAIVADGGNVVLLRPGGGVESVDQFSSLP